MENLDDQSLTNDDPLDEFMADDAGPDELRKALKEQLPAVVMEIEVALAAANLNYPVFLVIPSSGQAIVSVGTPLDPDDIDWNRIDAIVREVIGEKLGLNELSSVELSCAAANHRMMVVDILPDTASPL